MSARFYKIALAISVAVNVLLIVGFHYYLSIEGTLAMIEEVVGIVN